MNAPPGRRSPGAAISRATATSTQQADEANAHSATALGQNGEDAPTLFDVTSTVGAYGTKNYIFTETSPPYVRGPGPRPPTTGPQDAGAPEYWVAGVEQVVMRLVREHGEVTSDDVRAAYPDLPSASGAAIGALFKRLGRQGRLVLVAHQPSSRPEARGRVVGVWRPS